MQIFNKHCNFVLQIAWCLAWRHLLDIASGFSKQFDSIRSTLNWHVAGHLHWSAVVTNSGSYRPVNVGTVLAGSPCFWKTSSLLYKETISAKTLMILVLRPELSDQVIDSFFNDAIFLSALIRLFVYLTLIKSRLWRLKRYGLSFAWECCIHNCIFVSNFNDKV